ncbi:MAG: GNAT family N-acetyltransferase [Pseudomonadota bacterium]
MNEPAEIRAATEADAEALQRLYQALSPDNLPIAEAAARQIITATGRYPGSAILVAELAGQLAASATLIVIPNLTRGGRPYGLIENVITDPAHRRRGLGRALLNAATTRAWAHDCYKIMLITGSRDPATHAFYEAAGFTQSRTGYEQRQWATRA